ncbi:unnamed protein product [Arabidopsis lyrata]|nr:unnamed protein product [Arabidopsis lyrata]
MMENVRRILISTGTRFQSARNENDKKDVLWEIAAAVDFKIRVTALFSFQVTKRDNRDISSYSI